MRNLYSAAIFILFTVVTNAQQITEFSHYFYKPMVYNPAFTGAGDAANIMLVNHQQWSGFQGAPETNIFTLDGTGPNKKMGFGLNLSSTKQGLTNTIGGNVSYSYRLTINDQTHLAFGVSLGVIDQTYDFSQAIVENSADPTLSVTNQHKTGLTGNAGFAFFSKALEIGISVPQVLANKIKYQSKSDTSGYYTQVPNYMGYIKYKYFIIKEKGVSLVPQALVRFVPGTPFEYDGTVNLDWKEKFWIGATYKSNYALSANVGFRIYKQLYAGYSYDFIIGNIGKYTGLSNEIMLNYKFGKNQKTDPEAIMETIFSSKTKMTKNDSINLADLNTLLLKKLLAEVDSLFDDPKATKADFEELVSRISEFSNSHFVDPTLKGKVKKYMEMLKHPVETPHILVKGIIVIGGNKSKSKVDYSIVRITLYDQKTNVIIGVYTPKAKTGKYVLILKPGEKYKVMVECKGFQTYTKDLIPVVKKGSNEMTQVIKLKKESVKKSTTKKIPSKK